MRFVRRKIAAVAAIVAMVAVLGQTSPPVFANQVSSTLASKHPITTGEDDLLDLAHDAAIGAAVGGLAGVVEGFVACSGYGMVVGGLIEFGLGMVGGMFTHFLGDPYEVTGLPQRARVPAHAFD